MNHEQLNLVPEIIFNLVDKFKAATRENEMYNMQLRLEACRDYLNEALAKKKPDVFTRKDYLNKVGKR